MYFNRIKSTVFQVTGIALLKLLFFFPDLCYGQLRVSVGPPWPQGGAFPLVEGRTAANILIDKGDAEVVGIVAQAVASGIKQITGITPRVIHSAPNKAKALIIAGTLGHSLFIDDLIKRKKLNTADLINKWETYKLITLSSPFPGVDKALVVIGSDRRGTAYGLFELSKLSGVSPWIWWADVKPTPRKSLYLSAGTLTSSEPAVKYRGIFINDEDWGLNAWARRKMDTDIKDIGPKTYARVFELLLRLRSNLIWPAMHDSTKAFWYYKENPKLADKYAIVIGSTHCDMMLRSNTFEWQKNYQNEYGEKPPEYRYDKNKVQIYKYWEDRIVEAKNYEAIYTIGMRGVRDGAIQGPTTKEGKLKLMDTIFRDEQGMFDKYLGGEKNTPQIFCPYKEVLDLYRAGLKVPDDATLIWTDDNYGYIRQLSNPDEQKRSGKSGIYYHLSYLGGPHDYLWLTTTSPTLISYEMTKAYQFGADRLWVLNVGDIKPSEMETQFFLDLAWDVKKWSPENAINYPQKWAELTFGKSLAPAIGAIQNQYLQLAQNAKPEHLGILKFKPDAERERLAAYSKLVNQVETVKSKIQPYQKDAFFELIEYPVKGAALMNQKIFYADMSRQTSTTDKKTVVTYSQKSQAAFEEIKRLTNYYTSNIQNGKWDHIISYMPRNLAVYGMPTVGAPEVLNTANRIPVVYDKRYLDTTKVDGSPILSPQSILAADYSSKRDNANSSIAKLQGLGIGGKSITRMPFNGQSFNENDYQKSPYVEYQFKVKSGSYKLSLKTLPTHAIHAGRNLKLGIVINDQAPIFVDFNNPKEDKVWSANVLRGFAQSEINVNFIRSLNNTVRVYLMDTGLALSRIDLIQTKSDNE